MIFIDTNILLRVLTTSDDPRIQESETDARQLFQDVIDGHEEITTSEVVLHEAAYVLKSRQHYGLDNETIADYLSVVMSLPGLHLGQGEKPIFLRAIEIFRNYPKIEMADALVAARAERSGIKLATFDRRLANLPFVDAWEPSARS